MILLGLLGVHLRSDVLTILFVCFSNGMFCLRLRYYFMSFCRVDKVLLSTFIGESSLSMIVMKKQMVVTLPLNLICVKK